MSKLHISCRTILALAIAACSAEATAPPDPDSEPGAELGGGGGLLAQADLTQGMRMQGMRMQGMRMQGMTMEGVELGGATLNGKDWQLQVSKGELIATRTNKTLRGTALAGMHVFADVHNTQVSPPDTAVVEYRITSVVPETNPAYDPTHTGNTFLYTLEQWVPDTSTWEPACDPDSDGRAVAIPLAAVWDDSGARVESTTLFTLGCTTGVIAKCYRWGYRPWVTGYGDLVPMHQTCTRLARADYCGVGEPNTHDGTLVNVWDRLPLPGPIQDHGGLLPPLGFTFEAGWDPGGAVCLSRARWLLDDGQLLAALCPHRLVPPGLLGATVCDTVAEVLLQDPDAKLFNESKLLNNLLPQ